MESKPVTDWTTDYDILDPDYVADPYPVWDDLREQCPIAHSDRWGGSWLPTRYSDVQRIAQDHAHFSSRDVGVLSFTDEERPPPPIEIPLPPIDADQPVHTWTRRLLLPWFSHTRVAQYEPYTRDLCNRLIDGFIESGSADAAGDYARQIPVRVDLAPARRAGRDGRHIHRLGPGCARVRSRRGAQRTRTRRHHRCTCSNNSRTAGRIRATTSSATCSRPRSTVQHVDDLQIMGIAALTLIAGVDTTWSSIGSAMLHLATHPDDVKRLIDEPEIMPLAIEELLRAYSPVTMARIAVEDIEVAGCPMKAGDKVLMNFPGANRDPEVFENPDDVILDRAQNRHVAFGAGIHRCAGSNLARMEMRVAVEEWIRADPLVPSGRQRRGHLGGRSGPRTTPGARRLLSA